MVKLTPKLISTEFPDQDPQSMQKLLLPGKGIEKVHCSACVSRAEAPQANCQHTFFIAAQILRLSTCSQLIRLDLSNNSLTSLAGVSQNTTLKWLSAQSNQITSLNGTDSLKQLQVYLHLVLLATWLVIFCCVMFSRACRKQQVNVLTN